MDGFSFENGGDHKMVIHLDGDSVGHGFIEMVRPGFDDHPTNSEFYGKYPNDATFGDKATFWDNGIIVDDRERFDRLLNEANSQIVSKEIALSEEEFNTAMEYINGQLQSPDDYGLLSGNCIGFVQDVYSHVKTEDGDFTDLFSGEELNDLSALSTYLDVWQHLPETPPIVAQDNYDIDPWDLPQGNHENTGEIIVEEAVQVEAKEDVDAWTTQEPTFEELSSSSIADVVEDEIVEEEPREIDSSPWDAPDDPAPTESQEPDSVDFGTTDSLF